jgi:hypothetical protein
MADEISDSHFAAGGECRTGPVLFASPAYCRPTGRVRPVWSHCVVTTVRSSSWSPPRARWVRTAEIDNVRYAVRYALSTTITCTRLRQVGYYLFHRVRRFHGLPPAAIVTHTRNRALQRVKDRGQVAKSAS